MISINKIREKSGLLLIFLGVTMLAFILGDYFSSRPTQRVMNIGTVYGEEIEAADFENKVAEQESAFESVNQTVDENTREEIRNQVWGDIIRERVLGKELEELGIIVANEEYNDIRYGNNVLPDLRNNPNFVDQATGQFNPQLVKQYFSSIQEQVPLLWKNYRDRLLDTRKIAKYNNLIKKGIFVNKIQAEAEHIASNRKVNFNYVVAKYASIPDSTVKVTEDELRAYFKEHKSEEKYKQIESRSIDYVIFEVKPTPEDIKATEETVAALAEPFKATTDDSTFVANNSANHLYQPEIYAKGSAEPAIDTQIVSASKGTVIGPFKMGDNLRIVKVVNNGKVQEVNARHILLKPTNGSSSEQLKSKADSIMKDIKKNNNFADVARQISDDKGSGANGGNLDWFGEGAMVKPFEEAAFSGNKGDLKIAETQFGVHIIEILDKRFVDQIKLAVIQRPIEPSKATTNAVYEQASSFSINNNTSELFNKGVEEKKLNKQSAPNITPQNKFIPGINEPDQILRWMYGAEAGQVSEPFEVGNQFVVATLTMITEEGEPTFEVVEDQMEREVIKEKKAAVLTAKIKGNNLTSIANSLGETVQVANDIVFNTPVLPGAGREPKVIGIAMTLPRNAASKPVIGENGVYVLEVTNVTEAPPIKDFAQSRMSVAARYTSRVDYAAFNSLVELAKVKDLRYKFY